jgi:hypothetical protein
MAESEWQEVEARPGMKLQVRLIPNRNGRMIVAGLHIEADAVTGQDLRELSLTKMERVGQDLPPPPGRPLVRPDGTDYVGHRSLVAEHYRYWAARSPHPGKLMAEACGAPAPTVHTWIREARLLGLLPAARRGKAG